MARLFAELKLSDATVIVHDWGGPIGLRVAVEHPDRVGRMVLLNTGPFTGYPKMTDSRMAFRELARSSKDLPVSFLIRAGCKTTVQEDAGHQVGRMIARWLKAEVPAK